MISQKTLICLQNILDKDKKNSNIPPSEEFKNLLKECGAPEFYATDMGKMLLAAKVEAELDPEGEDPVSPWEFDDVCQLGNDKRCQAGHIIRSLIRRMRRLGRDRHFDERSTVQCEFRSFLNNARSTVLIFDGSSLNLRPLPGNFKVKLDSVPCRDWLDLSSYYNFPDEMKLCSSAFYAREQIPYTDIFGSGYMVNHDTVVTAAHVLEQAYISNVEPRNLVFLRRHLVYNTKEPEIWAFENQFYKLDQDELIVSKQMKNGSMDGDMAWVNVKPLGKARRPHLKWNGIIEEPVKSNKRVYALGHGLGIPMKISFDGKVQDGVYHQTPSMFTCDMHILPGNSGCPIFDFESHKLVGIISGLHKLHTVVGRGSNGDCIRFEIDMKGKPSAVATHIEPFKFLKVTGKQKPASNS